MWTPAAPGGLREADVAELAEQHPRLRGDEHGVGEVGARLRVEIEPQLVRMVDVLAAYGPRMKRDRAHLRRPADDRDLRRTDLIGMPTRRELDLAPSGRSPAPPAGSLLEEGIAAPLLPRR